MTKHVPVLSPVIEIKDLTKSYGSNRGIENVSLTVREGTISGFLGPNGAGKTTMISTMLDLIHPTSGEIKLFGLDNRKDSLAIRRRIGFLPGDVAMNKNLTGWQQLEYFGNLRGDFDKKYVRELAKRLSANLDRKIKQLSRGNRQKVGLISALAHKPDLLILDEPTSGLDPLIQAEFNQLMMEHKAAGRSAFISSHVLSEVQELCDTVAFIREGKLVAQQDVSELRGKLPKQLELRGVDKKLLDALRKHKAVRDISLENEVLSATVSGDLRDLLAVLSKHTFQDISLMEPDLEMIFMKYYEGINDA